MNANSTVWDRSKVLLLESDVSYFRRRAAEERFVAMDCHHPRVRQAHEEMADRYEDLARSIVLFEHHLGHRLESAA